MAKLLPPLIESKLPAQVGNTLVIPYLNNRSVSPAQCSGFSLKIKTASTNQEVGTLKGSLKGIFKVENIKLTSGQFYKVQLAYIDTANIVGNYSTVGVFKYLLEPPQVYITSSNVKLNSANNNYINAQVAGNYSVPVVGESYRDTSERVYSYKFNIYKDNNLLTTSGDLLHNHSNDIDINSSIDEYVINNVLEDGSLYHIEYVVTTTNGLVIASPKYKFTYGAEVDVDLPIEIVAESNCETGSIDVYLSSKSNYVKGYFRLIRFSSLNNNSIRETIQEFYLNSENYTSKKKLFTDYTVQQGVTYKYGIQQFNTSGVNTTLIMSNSVRAEFEDMFLSDGERQLNIKFNPKVSSFKTTTLESKLDTLGGTYPFVFRNGRTAYKDMAISGLISYWMDNEELFLSDMEKGLKVEQSSRLGNKDYVKSLNLDGANFEVERTFKLEVMNWLNNGRPKLFRSPAEGNYIVRLMNVTLSPNDTLGRMLHTFNCQAYEIYDNTVDNLKQLSMFKSIDNKEDVKFDHKFYSFDGEGNKVTFSETNKVVWFRLLGDIGSKYKLIFENQYPKQVEIEIGASGMYEAALEDDFLLEVELSDKNKVLDLPHSIEYAINTIIETPISVEGHPVKQVYITERMQQISKITDNVMRELCYSPGSTIQNILVAHFRIISEANLGKGQDYLSINEDIIDISGSKSYQITANDYGGKFIPDSIYIGSNIELIIYYRVKDVIFEEEKNNHDV